MKKLLSFLMVSFMFILIGCNAQKAADEVKSSSTPTAPTTYQMSSPEVNTVQ